MGWRTEGDVRRLPDDVAVGSEDAGDMRAVPCESAGFDQEAAGKLSR